MISLLLLGKHFPRRHQREKYIKEELGFPSYDEFLKAQMAYLLGITLEQYKKEAEK